MVLRSISRVGVAGFGGRIVGSPLVGFYRLSFSGSGTSIASQ